MPAVQSAVLYMPWSCVASRSTDLVSSLFVSIPTKLHQALHLQMFETQNFQLSAQIYTTKLDKSKAGISEREATRIAREIEGRKTNNPHLAEERGHIQYREMVICILNPVDTLKRYLMCMCSLHFDCHDVKSTHFSCLCIDYTPTMMAQLDM